MMKLVSKTSSLNSNETEGKGTIAVDCEGLSLSSKGALTIITVATEEKIYTVDVLKLGKTVFSGGLSEILGDKLNPARN